MTCNDCVHSEVCKYRPQLDLCDNYPSENCEDYKDKTSFLNTHFSDDAILYIIQWCIESQSGSDKVISFIIPYLDKLNMRYLLKIKEVIENHRRYGRWFGDHYYHVWNRVYDRVNDLISYKELKYLNQVAEKNKEAKDE